MKGKKLFDLLQALSTREFTGLQKAVDSPLFTSNTRIQELYKALKAQYPDFEVTQKGYELLFQSVYPEEPYNYFKFHRLLGQMLQLTEDYLLYLEQKKDKLKRQKELIVLYKNRNLKPLFDLRIKHFKKILKASPYRDLEYYEEQIFLNRTLYFNPMKDKYDFKDTSLDNLIDALERYFVLAKLRYGISVKNRERILRKPGVWRFTQILEEGMEDGFMQDSALVSLYQQSFLLLDGQENVSIEAYQETLFDHIDRFNDDAKVLFFSGLNYISRQINKGDATLSRTLFTWYRFGLEKSLLMENNSMDEATFGNIVIVGCREKEFLWVKNFIENYGKYLNKSIREDVLAYHLGLWHFYQKEFDSVLSIYFNYRFSKAYVPKTRLILIRALFELFLLDEGYFEVLNSNIKAFESFITRDKKFVPNKLIPLLNMVKIIEKITKMIYEKKPRKEIHYRMKQLILSQKIVSARAWLVEKSKEILQE